MSSNICLFGVSFVLGFFNFIRCDVFLHVTQKTNEYEVPVGSTVAKTLGSSFTFVCQIINNEPQNETYYDDCLSWVKQEDNLRFKNETDLRHIAEQSKELYKHIKKGEVNKAVLNFDTFSKADVGLYACVSIKYMLFRVVEVKEDFERTLQEIFGLSPDYSKFMEKQRKDVRFCSDVMFKCNISNYCINYHYVCDGKEDCRDGSDESWEQCGGDPCAGKIRCNYGRCIPMDWCCDIHSDSNCTVAVRPSCCPPLIDRKDPLQVFLTAIQGERFPLPTKQITQGEIGNAAVYHQEQMGKLPRKSNSTHFIVVLILCIIGTFLSVLLLIVTLSKLCSFTNKYLYNMNTRNNIFSLSRRRAVLIGGTVITRYSQGQPRECQHTECAIRREFLRSYSCSYRQNMPGGATQPLDVDRQSDVFDPLLNRGASFDEFVHIIESDQPPSYAEAVKAVRPFCSINNPDYVPRTRDFRTNENGFNSSSTPPPPYSSTEALQGAFAERDEFNGSNYRGSMA